MEIRQLRFADIPAIAVALDNDEARRSGLFINADELLEHLVTPHLRTITMWEGEEFAGMATLNIAELRYGRCELDEFYIAPKYRGRHHNWHFWKFILSLPVGCHRMTCRCMESNKAAQEYLTRLGWKMEAVLEHFTPRGDTYIQFSLFRRAGREG